MARQNTKRSNTRVTTNHEGAVAYKMSPEMELYVAVCTDMNEDKFYESASATRKRIAKLASQVDHEFLAKLAVYARTKMNMRSAPLYLTALLAGMHNGDDLVRLATRNVIRRADEMGELLATYEALNSKSVKNTGNGRKGLRSISKQMQRGIADAYTTFDAYQFNKYFGSKSRYSVLDVMRMVRPKPVDDEQAALFALIRQGKDAIPKTSSTIEATMANARRGATTEEEKSVSTKAALEAAIDSRKVGYMATLRNLRNYLEAGISSEHIEKVCNFLTNPKAVANSKQFPYRFYTSYMTLKRDCASKRGVKQLLEAIQVAGIISVSNLVDTGRALHIGIDVSGSMQSSVSAKSVITRKQIGQVLGLLASARSKNSTVSVFGHGHADIVVPSGSIFENIYNSASDNYGVGHATNGHLVLDNLKDSYDDIIIFTDEELWDTNRYYGYNFSGKSPLQVAWDTYRKKINPNARLFIVNLAGYGNAAVDYHANSNTYCIAGWSSEVFAMYSKMNSNEDVVLEEIYNINLV